MLKCISNDFYNIANRLKLIDSAYNVFYNTSLNLFQVYEVKKDKKIFLFNIGKNLNCLAIKKAFETCFRNFKKIFKEIDNVNRRIEKNNEETMLDLSKDMLNAYLMYADKSNKDIDFKNANKFKWF